MAIPTIIHQTWKTQRVPRKWRAAVASVKRYHPGWEYRLWTDAMMDDHVREHHPDFHPVFAGMAKNIMRADSFRYVLMHDIGGLYCDLDYEFLRPYDYSGTRLVLALERAIAYGDRRTAIANFVFASEPGHPFWRDVIDNLRDNPPSIAAYHEVTKTTGPGFLNRIYQERKDRYEGVRVENRIAFNPRRTHGRGERAILLNNGITYGLHLGGGSWKERWTWAYWKRKYLSGLAGPR